MPLFDEKSRYVKYATIYETIDARGRKVQAIGPAQPKEFLPLGDHLLKDHQRLDHLAAHYFNDPFGFWKIAEHNDVLLPDAATRGLSIRIPRAQ